MPLGAFIATAHKDDHPATMLHKVDAITGAVWDTEFPNTIEELRVTKITSLQTNNALRNFGPGALVF